MNLYFVVRRPKFCANEIIHLWNCLTLDCTRRKNDIHVIHYLIDRLLRKLSFCCFQVCMLDVHISFMENFVVHFNSKIPLYSLKILACLLIYCFEIMILLHPWHFRSLLFSKPLIRGSSHFFVLLVQKRAQFY